MRRELWFPIPPKVKQRPRLGRRGRVFTPQDTIEYENAIARLWLDAGFDVIPSETGVAVDMTFTPDGWHLSLTETERVKGLRGDLDNYVKTLDGLNGVAFDDDRQVVSINARKAPKGWRPEKH